MAKRLSEMQEKAYQEGLDFYFETIRISSRVHLDGKLFSSEDLKKLRGKIIEESDKICQGKGSIEGLDRIVYKDGGEEWRKLEEKSYPFSLRTEACIDLVAISTELTFDALWGKHHKNKIIQDTPYEPFIKLMRRHFQIKKRDSVNKIKRRLKFLETGEAQYSWGKEYVIKESKNNF